jgi:hypothetical protein
LKTKGSDLYCQSIGKEKKFMVSFSLLDTWGKHQDTVFELIRRLMTEYESRQFRVTAGSGKIDPQT